MINNDNKKKYKTIFNLLKDSKVMIKNLGENPILLKCHIKQTKKNLNKNIELFKEYKSNNLMITKDIDFAPNSPFEFSNPLFFGVSAVCNISSPAPEAFFGQIEKGHAKINGNNIPAEGLHMTVNNGDKFSLHADSYTTAKITNQGTASVHASCGLGVHAEVGEFDRKFEELLELEKTLNTHEAFFKVGDEKIAVAESLKFLEE